jgi:hypothetical protein
LHHGIRNIIILGLTFRCKWSFDHDKEAYPGGAIVIIRVQYHNGIYDLISAYTLQRLILSGKIKMFYRYSEKRWITIGVEPMRKGSLGLIPYDELDRRAPQAYKNPFLWPSNIASQLSKINTKLS